jgi:hypothetical protein
MPAIVAVKTKKGPHPGRGGGGCPDNDSRPEENSSLRCELDLCGTADGRQATQDCFSVISPGNLATGSSKEGKQRR